MKVFINAKIISPSANIPAGADAVAVKDGLISAIGTTVELSAGATEVIDLTTHTIEHMPLAFDMTRLV